MAPPDSPPPGTGAEALKSFMHGWSLEATLPKGPEFEAMGRHLPPGSHVYLAAIPTAPLETLVDNARQVAAAGLEPVPHVAVRNFASRGELAGFLANLHREAGVKRVLAIAGDRDDAAGSFESSLQLVASGLLQENGITGVSIGGYPDGHPKISNPDLAAALRDKMAAAREGGLEVNVVTQFCFDAATILKWVAKVRADYPEVPVRVGLAGPANPQTLFKYAMRCGVRASARGLGRGLKLLKNLKGEATPQRIMEALVAGGAGQQRPPVQVHFYAFGGVRKTAAWGHALAQGGAEPDSA